MYHSITFGDKNMLKDGTFEGKNTWNDWHLVPTSRPVIAPPSPKTQLVDIPGANGQMDLSCSLTGYPVFSNRTGSVEFAVANGYKSWEQIYSEIMNYLHGQTMKAVLEDDTGYYYEGRFSVNGWKSNKDYSLITIDYDVYPYKKELISTKEDWLWDPFDFDTGYIRDKLVDLSVEGNLTIEVNGNAERIVPTIGVVMETPPLINGAIPEKYMTLTLNGVTHKLSEGLNIDPSIVLVSGENTLIFNGYGKVSVEYRGGSL